MDTMQGRSKPPTLPAAKQLAAGKQPQAGDCQTLNLLPSTGV